MSAAQRFLTQRIIPLKEKKSRAEVEREVDGVRKEKERLTAAGTETAAEIITVRKRPSGCYAPVVESDPQD